MIQKAKVYVKNPSEAPVGVKLERGKRGGHYYESSQVKTNEDRDNFLYYLKYNYVNDFDKKNKIIFDDFYNSLDAKLRNNTTFIVPFTDITNNLSESITLNIAKVPIKLTPNSKFSHLTDYWAAAYDPDYKYIAINEDVYNSLSQDYYTQEQFHRVVLHEYGHKLIYDDLISEEMVIDLWDTKERVSKQSNLDFSENLADSFAAFFMALSSEGISENNRDLLEFKDEYPKSFEIWLNWVRNNEI